MPNIVICPHPPLLFSGLGGFADPGAELRSICVEAIRDALADAPAVVHLVGAGGEPWPGTRLPLSVAVGSHLLDLAGWQGPRTHHVLPEEPTDADLAAGAVLLMGDGSARRSERAPGHVDPRAEAFDESVEEALVKGDAEALAALDPDLGAELMAAGTEAFRALGRWGLTWGVAESQLRWAGAPYGVGYWVATWRLEPSPGAP